MKQIDYILFFRVHVELERKEEMVLYSTTFNIESNTVDRWRTWMNDYYLPLIRRSGYFDTYKIMRLIHEEEGGVNYSCQLYGDSMKDCQMYLIEHEQKVNQKLKEVFGEKCLSFSTVLEVMEEGEI